ncbi:MAG: arginine repressor [Lachnospiraceae bacterium]|jgi:transcriptional regulator of arginine metabolism|nr:arginine repressor [Lachnospiraceae bacterium]
MKEKRQNKIKEIIESKDIETQDELLAELSKAGFSITQATISRDIREMKLTKIQGDSGRQKYAMLKKFDTAVEQKYKQVLSAGILNMDYTDNLIVIRTVSGMAMAVAAALDNMEIPGLMGCIAGDDTIFAAARNVDFCKEIISGINSLALDK